MVGGGIAHSGVGAGLFDQRKAIGGGADFVTDVVEGQDGVFEIDVALGWSLPILSSSALAVSIVFLTVAAMAFEEVSNFGTLNDRMELFGGVFVVGQGRMLVGCERRSFLSAHRAREAEQSGEHRTSSTSIVMS